MAATQWEYEILEITGDLKKGLNMAGKDRWEAVAVVGSRTGAVTLIFKRPLVLLEIPGKSLVIGS